jgi:hypothetical protein
LSEQVAKPIRFTHHALARMERYGIPSAVVERAVRAPEWREPDPIPGVERRFLTAPELARRVVRVACVEEQDHIRILSVFPDRDARPPHAP